MREELGVFLGLVDFRVAKIGSVTNGKSGETDGVESLETVGFETEIVELGDLSVKGTGIRKDYQYVED